MSTENKSGQVSALISAIGNFLISFIKIVGGIFSGSVGLLSDGIHSFADVLSSIIVWIGLKISAKPPDVEHPYGHYKAENIASLFVALFIAIAGLETLWESFNKIASPDTINLNIWIFSIPFISAFGSLLLAEYKKIVGKKIHSPSLIAEGEHSFVDAVASGSVFVGLVFFYFGFPIVDPIVGLIISGLIIWRAYEIGKETINALMDSLLEPEVLDKIKSIVSNIEGVISVDEVKARSAGSKILVELTVTVPPEVNVRRAYRVHNEIVRQLKREIPQIAQVTIETKPLEADIEKIVIPVMNNKGEDSLISDHFGKSPYLAIVTLDKDKKIEKIEIIRNKFLKENKGIGADLVEYIVKKGVLAVIVKNIGKTAFKLLRSYGVDILTSEQEISVLTDAIECYVQKKCISASSKSH